MEDKILDILIKAQSQNYDLEVLQKELYILCGVISRLNSIKTFVKDKEKEHNKHNLFIEVIGDKLHIGNFTEHSMEAVESIDL